MQRKVQGDHCHQSDLGLYLWIVHECLPNPQSAKRGRKLHPNWPPDCHCLRPGSPTNCLGDTRSALAPLRPEKAQVAP